MSQGLLTGALRDMAGHPGELPNTWKCRKRDGQCVPFDESKIAAALERCFQAIKMPETKRRDEVAAVLNAVLAYLWSNRRHLSKDLCFDVETVQRVVISEIWGRRLFEAAELYQNYREEHRKLRQSRPISPEYAAAVAEDAKHFPSPLQYYQFISKFSRWNDERNRRETWREACFERIMPWFRGLSRVKLSENEWQELGNSLYSLETCCAMRVVQMAGPALERCHSGAYNCAYLPLCDLRSFSELLYILMQGSGVGFSVEDEYVSRLPRIRKQKVPVVRHSFVVPDSTEGWCDGLTFGVDRWFDGEDVWFDVSQIRPAGIRLKTKGGRASGPGPFLEMISFARKLILSRQGKVLSDLDCHDLACVIAKIVQVGGVRRASCISLSDLTSRLMRDAKSGPWYDVAKWRSMANNSAVYHETPDAVTFMEEWLSLAKSGAGERGIFNRQAVERAMPKRRSRQVPWPPDFDIMDGPLKSIFFGINPCGEILLRPFEFCNLSMAIARPWDTGESLKGKVRLATYWGCMQKTATNFRYIRSEWKKNCEEEALLGVDITGHADCHLLHPGAPGRAELIRELAEIVARTDRELSERFGVNVSAANTCIKPGGDSGVFFDCASGVSPRFSKYQVRWVRESIHSPVAHLLKDEGVPWATAPEDEALLVFAFPKRAPDGSLVRDDMNALQQLENWLEWKRHWAEHSVSCTVYVDDHEWMDVGAWVLKHFDEITGLSFLPKDNGAYAYAPNYELTAEDYAEVVAGFPELHWAKLCRYETEDQTMSPQTYACVGGSCERG